TLNGASSLQGALNQTGGILNGTGAVTITGLATWTAGTMSGAATTNANGGMSLPSGQITLDTRTLNVSGATTSGNTSGNTLLLQNGAVVNNLAGSIWTIVASSGNSIAANGGTGNTFNNAGTFQMNGGTTHTVSAIFNNTGSVNANAGTLTF